MLIWLTNTFPLWVLLASIISLFYPPAFTWFSGHLITFGLGMIMLGMGLTLRAEDFKGVFKYPLLVLIGVALQYTVMPFLGWSLSYVFHLSAPIAAGLILVSCCPGGTASNVITYLAKGNVPLSVTMTTVSTMIAVIFTPLLTTWLVGSRVDVNGWGLFWNTVQVVILPVAAGIVVNRYCHKALAKFIDLFPLMSVIFITLIVASIVGASREFVLNSGGILLLAVFALHALGFLLGYAASKLLIKQEIPARTISIEVGMQNSGLGVVLARQNFSDPLVAVASAISSLFHSLIGSFLAAIWRLDHKQHQ